MGFLDRLARGRPAKSVEDQISDRGVQWLKDHAYDEGIAEILVFVEPGASVPRNTIDATYEFASEPKLGILHGNKPGHALFRTEFLRKVLRAHSEDIADYSSLARAFMRQGYNIIRAGYISFR